MLWSGQIDPKTAPTCSTLGLTTWKSLLTLRRMKILTRQGKCKMSQRWGGGFQPPFFQCLVFWLRWRPAPGLTKYQRTRYPGEQYSLLRWEVLRFPGESYSGGRYSAQVRSPQVAVIQVGGVETSRWEVDAQLQARGEPVSDWGDRHCWPSTGSILLLLLLSSKHTYHDETPPTFIKFAQLALCLEILGLLLLLYV